MSNLAALQSPGNVPPYVRTLSGGRRLELALEPGPRPAQRWQLRLVANNGMTAGSFSGSKSEMIETLMGLQLIIRQAELEGLPGESR